jgi:hypothetical protein
MSNEKKVAQDRKEKIKKEKQELFEKVCLCLLSKEAYSIHNHLVLVADAGILTDYIYESRKGVK